MSNAKKPVTVAPTLAGTALRVRQDGSLVSAVPVADRGVHLRRELGGSTLADLVPAETAAELVQAVRSALTWRRGGLVTIAWGKNRESARAHILPLTADEALIVFDADSGQTQPELGLAIRETLHRMVVADSPNPIFLVNENRRVIEANPALSGLLGYTPVELLGLELYAIDTADAVEIEAGLQRITAAHHDVLGERQFRRKDGSVVPVLVSANLMFTTTGGVFCFFARDITDERTREDERRELERKLLESQKYDALCRLAAGVAHDFNALLTALQLAAHQLRDAKGSDDIAGEAARILEAAQRGKELSRQLLTLSGRHAITPRRLDLNETVQQAQESLRPLLTAEIRLQFRFDPNVGDVLADPQQIEQLLTQLVANAVDAMPDGGTVTIGTGRVVVDAERTALGMRLPLGQYAVLRVSDTGPGFEPWAQEQMFEPFYTTKPDKGTGLGLAAVKGIMLRLNGAIAVQSVPGQGATFELYFPWQSPPLHVDTQPTETNAATSRGERVLVADDDIQVRRLIARVLRQLGYTVYEAESGVGALEALAAFHEDGKGLAADALVTDVSMPHMTGPELVHQLRTYFPDLPVLFISGEPAPEKFGMNLDQPGTAFLQKPFDPSELRGALQKLLGH